MLLAQVWILKTGYGYENKSKQFIDLKFEFATHSHSSSTEAVANIEARHVKQDLNPWLA